jgi:hypothetical protein
LDKVQLLQFVTWCWSILLKIQFFDDFGNRLAIARPRTDKNIEWLLELYRPNKDIRPCDAVIAYTVLQVCGIGGAVASKHSKTDADKTSPTELIVYLLENKRFLPIIMIAPAWTFELACIKSDKVRIFYFTKTVVFFSWQLIFTTQKNQEASIALVGLIANGIAGPNGDRESSLQLIRR